MKDLRLEISDGTTTLTLDGTQNIIRMSLKDDAGEKAIELDLENALLFYEVLDHLTESQYPMFQH